MKAKGIPSEREGGLLSLFAMLGVVALPILCCAGPALVAGGALAGLGGAVSSPWLLLPALVLLTGGVALLIPVGLAKFRRPFPWVPRGWSATTIPPVVAGRALTSSARPAAER